MSPEEFEKMMRELPEEENTAAGSSSTPYGVSSKRARCDEDDAAPASVSGAPSTPQPQQIHQIRQIWEVKSRQWKAIEGLEKKVQNLEAELAKAHSEARDAFENGRMVALLSADTGWEAKEAKPRSGAELDSERQFGVVRNFLEGQIAELSKQLGQYRAEAGEYKKSVEGESYVAGLGKKSPTLMGRRPTGRRQSTCETNPPPPPQPPAIGALEVRIEEHKAARGESKGNSGKIGESHREAQRTGRRSS